MPGKLAITQYGLLNDATSYADYNSRRSGGQEENRRRRDNAHQMPLSARLSASPGRDSRDDGGARLRFKSNRKWAEANKARRKGRPAHLRSPNDSPLRDGNRDRLIGLLTKRAAKTLEYYFLETNLTYHNWLAVRHTRYEYWHSRASCALGLWRHGNVAPVLVHCRIRTLLGVHNSHVMTCTLEHTVINIAVRGMVQQYIRQNEIPTTGSWDDISGESFLRKLLTAGVDEASYKGGVSDPMFSCVGTIGIDPRAVAQRIMDIRTAISREFIQVRCCF